MKTKNRGTLKAEVEDFVTFFVLLCEGHECECDASPEFISDSRIEAIRSYGSYYHYVRYTVTRFWC